MAGYDLVVARMWRGQDYGLVDLGHRTLPYADFSASIAACRRTQLSYFESGDDTSGIFSCSATWLIVEGRGFESCTTTPIAPTMWAVRIA